jgi:hypothetical protein
MRILNRWLGLGLATWLCGALAAGSLALAFLGAERSGALMSRPPLLALTALLACGLAYSGARAVKRRRFDSALLHLGCACVMAGWLAGRIAERTSSPEHPAIGSMAMIDGDQSDTLYEGAYLTNRVGRVPFTVKLEHFFIEYYPASPREREEGRMPPVKEYRSRVTLSEPGKEPFTKNVRVNHPVYVKGYHIYQMSWGQSRDAYQRPVIYTVLQFIRDPGLPFVYAGFVVLLAGIVLFAVRVLRQGQAPGSAVRGDGRPSASPASPGSGAVREVTS